MSIWEKFDVPVLLGDVKAFLGALIILESMAMLIINALWTHYPGASYFTYATWHGFFNFFLLYLASWYIQDRFPRIALVFKCFWLLYAVTMLLEFYGDAAQVTPFPSIDAWCAHVDAWLGFDVSSLLSWTNHHPRLYRFFEIIYDGLDYELVVVPLLLACLYERRSMEVFFLTALISALIGYTIYYFFPTTDPAAVYHNRHFLLMQENLVQRFIEIHHHELLRINSAGGLIGFPSFHVIWALALLYAVRNNKYLFALALIFNSLVICSTLTLGWHYLSDVLGGIVVFLISTYFAEKSYLFNAVLFFRSRQGQCECYENT